MVRESASASTSPPAQEILFRPSGGILSCNVIYNWLDTGLLTELPLSAFPVSGTALAALHGHESSNIPMRQHYY